MRTTKLHLHIKIMQEIIILSKGVIALLLIPMLIFAIVYPANATQPADTLSNPDTNWSAPIADAGGPYVSFTGVNLLFEGSKSSVPAGLLRAVWNFGDGSYAESLKAVHSYASKGVYHAVLSITDNASRTAEDSRMVHINAEVMSIQISVLPKSDDGVYNPGESFSSIELNVTYPDGRPVEHADARGVIEGRSSQPIVFNESGNGLYRYTKDYHILNTDPPYIDLYVNVTDLQGNTGKALKKLRTIIYTPISADWESKIVLHDPSYNKFIVAYGESILFRVSLFATNIGTLHSGDVYLYEANTNERYPMQQSGDEFLLEYKVPSDAGRYLNLIIVASFSVNGVDCQATKEISFEILPELKLEVASPIISSGTTGGSEIKLAVSYPAGESVTEDFLNATIGNASITLQRIKENGLILYRANYSISKSGERPYIWVTDSSGNGAGIYLQPESEKESKNAGTDSRIFLAAGALIIFLALSFILLQTRYKKTHKRLLLVKEYEDLHLKIESLKKIRKNIMHEYYTRKITEQDARKRILETEKELVMERGNMRALMQKLGMAPAETEGKEEIIEWVTEKLKAGENMDLIKKGLKDLNIDPLLVERVRKTLT